MSGWTRPADLRAQVQRVWDRGEILAALITGETLFPKRLLLKVPTATEMSEQFDAVRTWIGELRSSQHLRIEWRDFTHRQLGANTIPAEAWIDTLEEATALIHKQRDHARFIQLMEQTRQQQPLLLSWLAKRPLHALELFDEWPRLLQIVAWLQRHPRPEIYLRQIDLPGVHTKLIESHRGALTELLDMALPADQIDATASGVSQFARRYGFRDKPILIRLRLLDPALLPSPFGDDITLDASRFAHLDLRDVRILITENETNFLALPPLRRSLVIFGKGYGFDMLRNAAWLNHCPIHYWGDIDTHGFAILDQLRNRFSHVESLLMDRATLFEFEAQWGEEKNQTTRDLPRLTSEERLLYDDLRDNRIRKYLRLEQERVGFEWVRRALGISLPPAG